MKTVKLHVLVGPDRAGRVQRRTFLIREDMDGDVDIVNIAAARLDADRSVTIDPDLVLEVERADACTM